MRYQPTHRRIPLLLAAMVCLWQQPAHAQKLDRVFKDWNVFSMRQDGQTVCYMASAPKQKSGTYKKRGEPYLLVTQRKKGVEEVSISAGYPYKAKSEVTVSVNDGESYRLFTKGELAWAYTADADKKMIAAMKKGSTLVASSQAESGATATDTYSLSGFTAAHARMAQLCR